jgi:hypothetical protein
MRVSGWVRNVITRWILRDRRSRKTDYPILFRKDLNLRPLGYETQLTVGPPVFSTTYVVRVSWFLPVLGEFHKSSGDGGLIEAMTVLLPAV